MKRLLKWSAITVAGLLVLILLAAWLVPVLVPLDKYRPLIEAKASQALGRPVTLKGGLRLSLFPWVGVSLSGLGVAAPPGFEEKEFLSVQRFEAHLKLLPLLARKVQVKRFLLSGPRLVLIKDKQGRGNWEGLGSAPPEGHPKAPEGEQPTPEVPGGLPIAALSVQGFELRDGYILWLDQTQGTKHELSRLRLSLVDLSLDRPIKLAFSGRMDGKPVSLKVKLGPLGQNPLVGPIDLSLNLKALDQLSVQVKGRIQGVALDPAWDLTLEVEPFSPRNLFRALGQPLPYQPADETTLRSLSLKAATKGNLRAVNLSRATLKLDDSTLQCSLQAKELSRPDLAFDLKVDHLDLDRYLPAPSKEKGPKPEKRPVTGKGPEKETDYSTLRRVVLNGTLGIGQLKAHGILMEEVLLKVLAKDGVFRADLLSLKVSQGTLEAHASSDLRGKEPKTHLSLQVQGVQAGPLIQALARKDFLEGVAEAKASLSLEGDEAAHIRQTLEGKGELTFRDGAIKGIDLAGMARNIKAAFGLGRPGGNRPRTEFTELRAPFTISRGVVYTSGTRLAAPLLRVEAEGKADLVQETLDFRVVPTLVATLKGKGDIEDRKAISVPLLVGGTFSSPSFRPDLKRVIRTTLQQKLPDKKEIKELLKGAVPQGDKTQGGLKEMGKELLKALPFGR